MTQPELFPPQVAPKLLDAAILENPLDSPLWPDIETALFEAMTLDTCNITMSSLKEIIRSGQLGVMVVLGGTLLNGVAVLDADSEYLDLPFVWSEGLETLNKLFEGAEAIAKQTGMRGVKWVTADGRSDGFAKRRGYRKRQVEYVKELTTTRGAL